MKEKYLKYILILFIISGFIFRLASLGSYIFEDEAALMIGGMKFFHQSYKDGLAFVEHPPTAIFLIGLPSTIIKSAYDILGSMQPGYYWFSYVSHIPLKDNLLPIRILTLFAGTLAISLIYLITKNLFGKIPALWAAALTSLSADFIFYSVHAFMESFMLLFISISLYLYIRFLDSKSGLKRKIIFLLLVFFIFMEAGSRTFNSLFLPLAVLPALYLHKRKFDKEFFLISAVIVLSVLLIYTLVWPAELQKRSLEINKPGLFGFSFFQEAFGLFSRNSYSFAFSLLLLLPLFLETVKSKKLIPTLRSKAGIIIIFSIISFFALGLTSLSSYGAPFMRYMIPVFIPLSILGGYAISRFSSNKIILALSLVFFTASAASIFLLLPNNLAEHSNLGAKNLSLYPSNEVEKAERYFEFLSRNGNPPVVTNEPNVLLFYKGNTMKATPLLGLSSCSRKGLRELLENNFTIIHRFVDNSVKSLRDDPNVCIFFISLNTREIERSMDYSINAIEDTLNKTTLERAEKAKEYLDSTGSPPLATNNNILISIYTDYNKQNSLPIPRPTDGWCLETYIQILLQLKPVIVFDTLSESKSFCGMDKLNISKIDSVEGFEIYKLND